MAYYCAHQLINLRHGEGVLWAGFIQVRKIYTYTPLPSFLFYHHCISQPFKVEHLFNSPDLLKLHHFIFDGIRMILGGAPSWLFLGGNRWFNVQMMANEARIHPWSFVSIPSEYVNIFLEEFHQLIFFLEVVAKLQPKKTSPDHHLQ